MLDERDEHGNLYYWFDCPMCDSRTVEYTKEICFCFGCGWTGLLDVLDEIQQKQIERGMTKLSDDIDKKCKEIGKENWSKLSREERFNLLPTVDTETAAYLEREHKTFTRSK